MYPNHNTGGDDDPLNHTQLYWQQVSLNNHLSAVQQRIPQGSIEMIQILSLWIIMIGEVEFEPKVNYFSF